MPVIRFQEKVPEVYVNGSRDFQLLCRILDVVINGVKYDIDGIKRIVNTHDCKSELLPLLQSKLGFFTKKEYTNDSLRVVLECLPALLRYKGTETAIKRAVNVFLKSMNIVSTPTVKIINKVSENDKKLYGKAVTDHCVVIGIDNLNCDVSLLKELLKYIVPYGYTVLFSYVLSNSVEDAYTYSGKGRILLSSMSLNSSVHGSESPEKTNKTVYKKDGESSGKTFGDFWDSSSSRYKDADPYKGSDILHTIGTLYTDFVVSEDDIKTVVEEEKKNRDVIINVDDVPNNE